MSSIVPHDVVLCWSDGQPTRQGQGTGADNEGIET